MGGWLLGCELTLLTCAPRALLEPFPEPHQAKRTRDEKTRRAEEEEGGGEEEGRASEGEEGAAREEDKGDKEKSGERKRG